MLRKEVVLSGMRSTGRIHLGNYHGALKNWVQLQNQYKSFFFVADWHALTTDYANSAHIAENSWGMVRDWLAAGLDPDASTIFIQSWVPEHTELHLLFSMITPLGWLERVPTYKDQMLKLSEKDLHTYGFLGYPVLQSADVALYKADIVPVGEDQVSHLELTRELIRRFNYLYCKDKEPLLIEPRALLTPDSKLPGLDGQKMSKSYNNTIALTEDPKQITTKIKVMPTDPARVRRSDPGEPEKCPVWGLHKVYSDEATKEWVQIGCRTAGIGCIECKTKLSEAIIKEHEPMRLRSQALSDSMIKDIVSEGAKKARAVAVETIDQVKSLVGLTHASR